ncbi:MAG: hypothetical protein KA190_23475, partial [Kofleriaceae bacterium]|nr:hypothetical protein [Kofleriaceae bacterium]
DGGGGSAEARVTNRADARTGGTIDSGGGARTTSTNAFGDIGALTAGVIQVDPADATRYSIQVAKQLEPAEPTDFLLVELYSKFGVFQNGVVTGTFNLTGEEANYVDCGACVRLLTDATQSDYGDDYMANGGTLNITAAADAVGETLTFTLSNVTFRHVDFTVMNNQVTAQADNASGCTTTISNATFTGALAAAQLRSDVPTSVVMRRDRF